MYFQVVNVNQKQKKYKLNKPSLIIAKNIFKCWEIRPFSFWGVALGEGWYVGGKQLSA